MGPATLPPAATSKASTSPGGTGTGKNLAIIGFGGGETTAKNEGVHSLSGMREERRKSGKSRPRVLAPEPPKSPKEGKRKGEKGGKEYDKDSRPRVLPRMIKGRGWTKRRQKSEKKWLNWKPGRRRQRSKREEEEKKLKRVKEARLREIEEQAREMQALLEEAAWPPNKSEEEKREEKKPLGNEEQAAQQEAATEEMLSIVEEEETEADQAGAPTVAKNGDEKGRGKEGRGSAPPERGKGSSASITGRGFLVFNTDDGTPQEPSSDEKDQFGGWSPRQSCSTAQRTKEGDRMQEMTGLLRSGVPIRIPPPPFPIIPGEWTAKRTAREKGSETPVFNDRTRVGKSEVLTEELGLGELNSGAVGGAVKQQKPIFLFASHPFLHSTHLEKD
ncbi:hypothetical protein niasHT_018371 [Heterodera trifolii]|uniref:Uncharacterized protein n=1 Tax=Heterodera trifolii TaxID=157864 RepID=A0ABD2LE96_9BILA